MLPPKALSLPKTVPVLAKVRAAPAGVAAGVLLELVKPLTDPSANKAKSTPAPVGALDTPALCVYTVPLPIGAVHAIPSPVPTDTSPPKTLMYGMSPTRKVLLQLAVPLNDPAVQAIEARAFIFPRLLSDIGGGNVTVLTWLGASVPLAFLVVAGEEISKVAL